MIKKNVRMGERTDVTLVEMGTGDILIAGIDWYEVGYHGVLFSQHNPKNIKEWNNVRIPIVSIEEAQSPVVIRFVHEESVDQLITSLMKVKEAFNNKKES